MNSQCSRGNSGADGNDGDTGNGDDVGNDGSDNVLQLATTVCRAIERVDVYREWAADKFAELPPAYITQASGYFRLGKLKFVSFVN